MSTPTEHRLRIAHFNDVYNIASAATTTNNNDTPVGGAARFVTALNSYKQGGSNYCAAAGGDPLVFCSGDSISPSPQSSAFLGKHMTPVLEACGVAAYCHNNHDLDFGLDVFEKARESTSFPWLCSNATEAGTGGRVFGGCERFAIVEHPQSGLRIGVLGLIEEEWLHVMYTLKREDIVYEDYVAAGSRLAAELRRGTSSRPPVALVFALSHMRVPNDMRLAKEAVGIDVVLGGHDHFVYHQVAESTGVHVIKSGCDFKQLGIVDLVVVSRNSNNDASASATIAKLDFNVVNITADIPEDPAMSKTLRPFLSPFSNPVSVGYTAVPLDVKTSSVRTHETAIANFVANCLLQTVPSLRPDVVLFNAGTLRADRVIPPGELNSNDLASLLPMLDDLVLLEITGEQLVEALENGVSMLPKQEGRFPCVAGVRFAFSLSAPPNQRVLRESVVIGPSQQPVEPSRKYRLLTKQYCSEGRDGYLVFEHLPRLVEHTRLEGGLNAAVRNVFIELEVIGAFREAAPCVPVQAPSVKRAALRLRRLGMLARVESSDDDDDDDDDDPDQKHNSNINKNKKKKKVSTQGGDPTAEQLSAEDEQDLRAMSLRLLPKGTAIQPRVDGRILQFP